MVTSIDIGENGRLGNQLFQYAAVKALALENNYDCVLPLSLIHISEPTRPY